MLFLIHLSFLALAFPSLLSFIFFCLVPGTPQTRPWAVSLLVCLLPVRPSMLSRLRYPTLFQLALLLLSPIQPCRQLRAISLSARSLCYIAISTFTRLFLFQLGTRPVFYYHSCSTAPTRCMRASYAVVFSGAFICAVSTCFTNFVFPSHKSPAHSSFGTITFIILHILILVSGCEYVRTASISPFLCVYPFLLRLLSVRAESILVRSLS